LAIDANSHSLNVPAYSDDGDRRFRFIVTGLERGEVLGGNDNSVGHDGIGIGPVFRRLAGTAQRLALEGEAMSVM
jgi:hypothetical protein